MPKHEHHRSPLELTQELVMQMTSLAVQTLILIVATIVLCGHGISEARLAKMRAVRAGRVPNSQ